MKLFISWAKEPSRSYAYLLRELVSHALQPFKPFLSEEDIHKGSRGFPRIQKELETTSNGLICVTPYNLTAPWLNFEAGAISKVENSAVFPVLFGVSLGDMTMHPFIQFQMTLANDEADMRRLLRDLNERLGDDRKIEERIWGAEFERRWPVFDAAARKYAELHEDSLKTADPPRVQKRPDDSTRARLPMDTFNRERIIDIVPRFLAGMNFEGATTDATPEGSEPLVFVIDKWMDRDLVEHFAIFLSENLGVLNNKDEYPVYVKTPDGPIQRIHWDPTKS